MITPAERGVYLDIHVQPGSQRPGVRGIHGERLKVAVGAPAREGRANDDVARLIADLMGVTTTAVTVVAGRRSRRKRVHVEGVDPRQARLCISAVIEGG